MFGLDLIYKIELKLQLFIKGRLTSVLLRMGSPKVPYLDLYFFFCTSMLRQFDSFYLFADDTNILYSHKNLKSLENVMKYFQLYNVFQWLKSNKLTLNQNKSNCVIFRPYQKRLPFAPKICILDHQTNTLTYLECKLSWKNHVDPIALKIRKTIGLLSKLSHLQFPYS